MEPDWSDPDWDEYRRRMAEENAALRARETERRAGDPAREKKRDRQELVLLAIIVAVSAAGLLLAVFAR